MYISVFCLSLSALPTAHHSASLSIVHWTFFTSHLCEVKMTE